MQVRVGDIYAATEILMSVGKQEMDFGSAEKIAGFIEKFLEVLLPLDTRRNEMLQAEYGSDRERIAAFNEFADEKVELPEFNFKEFSFLRITPDGLSALKRAGLYAQALDS